jgi:hypothetical protein
MRRRMTVIVALALSATVALGVTGCGQSSEANRALDSANKQLSDYSKLDRKTSILLGQLLTVQPTGTSVHRGQQVLDSLDPVLSDRDKTAKAAKAEFQRIQSMKVKEAVRGYAAKAIAYTDALLVLDAALQKLSGEYRALFDHVEKRSDDLTGIQELTTAVDEQTKLVDAERVKAQSLLDAADTYYQENLAAGAGSK